MGCQFSNYQVRYDSQSITVECVREIISGRSYVSPPRKGWITIYNDRPSEGYTFTFKKFNASITARFQGQPHKILPYCRAID
jgi:hypothetical protein